MNLLENKLNSKMSKNKSKKEEIKNKLKYSQNIQGICKDLQSFNIKNLMIKKQVGQRNIIKKTIGEEKPLNKIIENEKKKEDSSSSIINTPNDDEDIYSICKILDLENPYIDKKRFLSYDSKHYNDFTCKFNKNQFNDILYGVNETKR